MIDIVVNLTDEEEAVLVRLTKEHNRDVPPPPTPLTPGQFLRRFFREWVRSQAARLAQADQGVLRDAYVRTSAAEKAQIDTILAKYR